MASKKDVIDEIIEIRYPHYIQLKEYLFLNSGDFLSEDQINKLNKNDKDFMSTVREYISELDKKSLDECIAILKFEKPLNLLEKWAEKLRRKKQADAQKADFEYWNKMARWTLEEGISLIMDRDPRIIHTFPDVWDELKNSTPFRDYYSLAECASEAGKLNTNNPPLKFITWANKIGLPVPDKFNQLTELLPPVPKPKIKKSTKKHNKQPNGRDPTEGPEMGSPEWRHQTARTAANARHDKPGGSRDKQEQMRKIWATGKYSSRDICAEQECAALDMSFSAARNALKNTPNHK